MADESQGKGITLGIEWGFGPRELADRIFSKAYRDEGGNPQVWMFLQELRSFMAEHGIAVTTLDRVDLKSPDVPYVLYFDLSWHRLLRDRHLFRIPREKRVLLMLEPSNVNPSLHLLPWLRWPFSRVFTFNDEQVARYGYNKISYFVLGNMLQYRTPPFRVPPFAEKKLVIGINSNRWAYMPTSTYSMRRAYFRFFEQRYPGQFDLYGHGWNRPCVFYERWFGHPRFESYRGEIPEDIVSKIEIMSRYRFHLCIENNINEPGYVSEKMTDCFCARCVPLYMGWRHADRYIPRECFIDLRDFDSIESVCRFMESMGPDQYQRYLEAIERFMNSERAEYFTNANAFRTILRTLFPARAGSLAGASGVVQEGGAR